MIQQIKWGSRNSKEPPSPFGRGNATRPIRITLHSSSFDGAGEDQVRAIAMLRDLTKFTAVEVLDTAPGGLPYLEIEDCNRDGSTIPIAVKDGKNWKIKSGIRAPENLFNAFASSVEKSRSERFDRQSAYQDFLVARANYELTYDLLITLSPCLLGNRENPWIRFVNLRSPLEAVKIIGLLLRTRGGYLFEPLPHYFLELDRRSIYKKLLRHKLPNLSCYIKACAHAESFGADGITYLAESALVRCMRALQARDDIGELFYMPQSNDSRDVIMYHFDYLALLLAGAFDAQARVARLVYRINDINEKNAGFHLKNFRKAVRRSDALELSMLLLEPYSYAINLVDECFRQIDEIATLTDVTRLLPADFDMSQLRENPSYDENHVEFVRQRVELLD